MGASKSSPQRSMGMSSMVKGGGKTPMRRMGLSGEGLGRTKSVSRGKSPYRTRLGRAGEG